MDIRLDDGNSSMKTLDIFILTLPDDRSCYEDAMLMQDWTRQCDFLTRDKNKPIIQYDVTEFSIKLENSTKLQDLNLNKMRVYIDNSPFPTGL